MVRDLAGCVPFWATMSGHCLSGTLDGSAGSAIALPGLLSTSHGSPCAGVLARGGVGVAVQFWQAIHVLYPRVGLLPWHKRAPTSWS